MARTLIAALVVVATLGMTPGCEDDFEPATQVLFRGQHPLLSGWAHDTGFQPSGSGVQVKIRLAAAGDVKAEALGQAAEADGPIKGIRRTGKLTLDGRIKLEVLLKINANGAKFEGPLKAPAEASLKFAGLDTFDPFLLGTHKTLTVIVPRTRVASIPLKGQVPDATGNLVIHLGGKLLIELHGVCARAAAGIAGYSARTVTSGALTVTAGGQILVKGKASDLPATSISVGISAAKVLMDLGSRPVKHGVAPGKGPCAVAVDAGPDGALVDSGPDTLQDLAPKPDTGSCSSTGVGTGSLCKKASDCKCPGTCLKIFKSSPGSCWSWCVVT